MLKTQVILMMGLPGSGKSTWIKENTWGAVEVCSADHYHEEPGGEYVYKNELAGESHARCFDRFDWALGGVGHKLHFLIVDNTNLTLAQISPYITVARQRYFDPRVVLINADHEAAFDRNKHGLPGETFEIMVEQLIKTRAEWPPFFPAIEEVLP
jgi:predicted kinase